MTVDPSRWSGRRVLVTGHTGFKGSWLSLWLQEMGARVSGLAPGPPTSPSLYEAARVAEHTEEYPVDVRDPVAVREALAAARPEVVLHLAAQPMVRQSLADPRATYEINVMGTVNLLEAVRAEGAGVRAVVVVTSDKCYENPGHGAELHAFTEGEPMGGSDPYSSSKGAAELVTAAFRRSYFSGPSPTRVATARAGNVIGGGDWGADRLVPDMVRAAAGGEAVQVRNPDAVRPWQHVLNPLSGYLVLAQELLEGRGDEPWNFGPDHDDARPVRWIAQRLGELWPGGLRWETDGGPHPPEARYLMLDSAKAHARLGWRPAWDLDEALRRIVLWHRALDEGREMRAFSISQIEDHVAGASAGGAA